MQNDGLTLQTVVLHWNIERRRNNCTVLIRDVNSPCQRQTYYGMSFHIKPPERKKRLRKQTP